MSKKRKSKTAAAVTGMAADTWEKLEQIFESRVARVLNAMQIPTHDDVSELAKRVEELTRVVEKLTGEPLAAPKKARRRKTASKKTSTRSRARSGTSKKKRASSR